MVKEIQLTQGKVALVDDADYECLMQWKWRASLENNHWYVRRYIRPKRSILMHRQLLNTPKGMETDHVNHNGLDNRRCNIRICTTSENQRNRKINSITNKTSVFKGVHWVKKDKRWYSKIILNQKHIFLGLFDTEIDAARAYDIAAIKYFGEFASLNLPIETKGEVNE